LLLATVVSMVAGVFATAASAAPSGLLGLTSARWSPSGKAGCGEGATTANGVITIPIEVFKFRQAVEPIVDMCFDGKGPYPMALDTGAAISVITTRLAKELRLKPVGSPIRVRGAGCATMAHPYELEARRSAGSNSKAATYSRSTLPGKAHRVRWARSAPTSSAASARSRSTSGRKR
jgi:hypothetical protein